MRLLDGLVFRVYDNLTKKTARAKLGNNIRKFKLADLPVVMDLWLSVNCEAHNFVDKQYWLDNFDDVKAIIPKVEVFVWVQDGDIKGFIGIDKGYIAGIFVESEARSQGIGKQLLAVAKELYPELTLHVYEQNAKASKFYLREGFVVYKKRLDEANEEVELAMEWYREE